MPCLCNDPLCQSTPQRPRCTSVLPAFSTKEDAEAWMEEKVSDDYTDNYRFAFLDDSVAMTQYDHLSQTGCCGSFDEEVLVHGRKATIGCNYGH